MDCGVHSHTCWVQEVPGQLGFYAFSLVQDGPHLFSVVSGSIVLTVQYREDVCAYSIPSQKEGPDN